MTSTTSHDSAGGKAGEAIRDARERSLTKMVQLEQAEDDTVLMVQEVTERLLRQRAVLRKTNPRNPDQLMLESNAVEQLKAEQKLLCDAADIILGPFLAQFAAPPRPARAALLGAHADRVLIGC